LTDNYYVNRILSSFFSSSIPQPLGRFLAKASVTLRDAERHLQVKEPSYIIRHPSTPVAWDNIFGEKFASLKK